MSSLEEKCHTEKIRGKMMKKLNGIKLKSYSTADAQCTPTIFRIKITSIKNDAFFDDFITIPDSSQSSGK